MLYFLYSSLSVPVAPRVTRRTLRAQTACFWPRKCLLGVLTTKSKSSTDTKFSVRLQGHISELRGWSRIAKYKFKMADAAILNFYTNAITQPRLRYSHKIWHDGRYGQSATFRNATFDLCQNPRWRPAAILKKENRHNSAAISVNLIHQIWCAGGHWHSGSPQRPLAPFLGYSKIQDGGWPPF